MQNVGMSQIPHAEPEVTENKRKKVRIENAWNDNLEKNDYMIVAV